MTIEEIFEEVKRKYPKGTRYRGAANATNRIYIVENPSYFEIVNNGTIWGERGKEYLYKNGNWAEIIESEYQIY